MLKKRKTLPPLDYFLAFEATAERGSIARAAEVLHISESSISRKLRLLEQHYSAQFFERGQRSIKLTQQGVELQATVAEALGLLRDRSQEILAKHEAAPVTLAATNSVASLWLMPRLREFDQTDQSASIMLVASDDDAECLADTVDLAILRGDGEWPGYDAQLLFGETVFPVCAPSYLDAHPEAANLGSLPGLDLVEVSSAHTEWMDWRTWFGQQNLEVETLHQTAFFNTYPLAVQAAVDGLGIALGWGHLVDRHLDEGRLVRPVEGAFARTKSGYYLLTRDGKPSFRARDVVKAWLSNASAARRRYG